MPHPKSEPRAVLRGSTSTTLVSPPKDEGWFCKTLLITAAVQLSTGSLFLGLAWWSNKPIAYRAWAGAILLATAVAQGKLALKALKQQRAPKSNIFRRTSFWRTLFIGVVLCYLGSLALGPNPGTPYAFAAAVSVWYTLMLLPIAVSPQVLEIWKRISGRRIVRYSAGAVFIGLLLAVAGEVSLRGYMWVANRDWLSTETATGQQIGQVATDMAEVSNPVPNLEADSRFHVAIVGDEVTLGSIHNDGALSQLEVLVPGVRVTNFSVPNGSPREYAQDLADRVLDCHPDLVLTFVSVGDDILAESVESEWFDWRSLALARLIAKPQAAALPACEATSSLQGAGRELVVCRTPTDAATACRWTKTFKHLQNLVRTCQRSKIDVALVVVPSEFQVNRVLLETLCRRMGYEPKEIDLDLPQRRLATFAGDHRVPYVDLLPHLRLCEESPYEHDTRQWNSAGAAVALHTIGGWLQSRYGNVIPAATQVTKH